VVSDEDIIRYEAMQRQDKEYMHGQLAVEAGRLRGILPESDSSWEIKDEHQVDIATNDIDVMLSNWHDQLEQSASVTDPLCYGTDSRNTTSTREGRILPLSDLWNEEGDAKKATNDGVVGTECITATDINNLNEDQRRAYNIVDWHLQETLDGKNPPQLLMFIPGEGGVGKSKLIQTIKISTTQHGPLVGKRSVYRYSSIINRWEDFTCLGRHTYQRRKTVSTDIEETSGILAH
jgi:hypothetical protein